MGADASKETSDQQAQSPAEPADGDDKADGGQDVQASGDPPATAPTDPPPAAASDPSAQAADASAQAQEAKKHRDQKKAESETNPFDLFVLEDTRKVPSYDPNSEFWLKQFRQKHATLKNWHAAIGHLRIFVSTSRLTAQSMLVAAAFILGLLILASIVQVANGAGPVDADAALDKIKDVASRRLQAEAHAGHLSARQLQESMLHVTESLAKRRLLEVASTASAVASLSEETLSVAAERLRQTLRPVRASMQGTLWRQYQILTEVRASLQGEEMPPAASRRLAERKRGKEFGNEEKGEEEEDEEEEEDVNLDDYFDMMKNVDMTRVTKTQLFSLVMVVLVMIYSVPLMWNIVQVNGYFDRHEDLLIQTSEAHRINQDRRELKRAEEQEKASEEQSEPQSTPAGVNKDLTRYEGLLATTTESARKTRERFPLKLFGFVISGQLLATWIVLAAAPVADQVNKVTPALVGYACHQATSSTWLASLQDKINSRSKKGNGIQLNKMLEEYICKPMMKKVKKKVEGLTEKSTDSLLSKAGAAERRLSTKIPDVTAPIQEWWTANSKHSGDAKLVLLQLFLDDLRAQSDRLLSSTPRAAVRAFESGGTAGLWQALGTVRHSLEQTLASEAHEEDMNTEL